MWNDFNGVDIEMIGAIGFLVGAFIGSATMAFMAGARRGDDAGFSCWGCKYSAREYDYDGPCLTCRRGCEDKWEARNELRKENE